MTENEKTELFDKWYDENYDEWAEGEEGIALREELEQAFKGGIAELENKIADIKANCDLAIEGRDLKIDELEQKLEQTEKDLADYQFNYPKLKELQKENAELRHINSVTLSQLNLDNGELIIELTKAKELLELFIQWNYGCCKEPDYKDIVKQAEQFLEK